MHLFDSLTSGGTSSVHCPSGGGFERTTWDELVRDAVRTAAGLRRLGIGPGATVASVLTNSRSAVSGLLGVWLAGGTVASLPAPARAMSIEDYGAQLAELCRQLGTPLLALEHTMTQALPENLLSQVSHRSWEELPVDEHFDPSPPNEDDVVFVQFSSGSTSTSKGCMLTARAIGNQLEMIADRMAAVPGEEIGVFWIPLSHDMGMFGCLLFAWTLNFEVVFSSPQRFIADPRTWFRDCADFGATLTAGTPSALHVAVRAHRTDRLSRELALRACVVGAESISYATLASASDAFAPYGLSPCVWMPSYGLAEATLMVTTPRLDEGPQALHVDSRMLAEEQVRTVGEDDASASVVVSVGRPCPGVEVELADPEHLSEIKVRSPSLFSGYLGDPELTRERLHGDVLATGDLGFERDGQLYMVGRADDLLTIAGRNVYAREIEADVDLLEPVRSGCSTMVDVGDDGRGQLVMLIELNDEAVDCRALAREVARSAKTKAGVLLNECVFLPRGTLPKTPNGKIQRFRCRHLLESDSFESIARIQLRPGRRSRSLEAATE